MTGLQMILELFLHMAWADAMVWQCVLSRGSVRGDERVRDRLHHMHLVQRGFLMLWRDPSVVFPDPPVFPDVERLASWGRAYHREVAAFLVGVDEDELRRPVRLPWADRIMGRPTADTSAAQTMVQVALHSAHHRGQVNTRIRELGEEPPLVDFIAWVWLGSPPAVWPPT